ncbi:MAG TPA: hypothetical protein PLL20_19395 [Phycisphaerae bacterium]|nr:hypothetical protein [Phycisphaerae bacterium]
MSGIDITDRLVRVQGNSRDNYLEMEIDDYSQALAQVRGHGSFWLTADQLDATGAALHSLAARLRRRMREDAGAGAANER